MNRREQARRDDQLARGRACGFSEARLAEAFGVSPRTVRRAYRKYREELHVLEEDDPLRLFESELLRLEWVINDLAMIRMHSRSSSKTLRAIAAQLRAMKQYRELLFKAGIVRPVGEGYEQFRGDVAADLLAYVKARLKEDDLPVALFEWLLEVFEKWLKEGKQPSTIPQNRTGLGTKGVLPGSPVRLTIAHRYRTV